MRRLWRRTALCVATLVLVFLGLVLATARPGDARLYPAPAGERTYDVYVVSHGYHSGLILPRSVTAGITAQADGGSVIAVATRFAAYPWLEIGWGDEGFYRHVPTAGSLTFALAVRALLLPDNPSVLHVVGLAAPPRESFPLADLVRIELGEPGFERLVHRLDTTFARDAAGGPPRDLGPGLYGPSLFYPANGCFNLLRVCNHWVADLLDAAGVPTTPVLAALPAGLLLDLRWRSGLETVPAPRGGAP